MLHGKEENEGENFVITRLFGGKASCVHLELEQNEIIIGTLSTEYFTFPLMPQHNNSQQSIGAPKLKQLLKPSGFKHSQSIWISLCIHYTAEGEMNVGEARKKLKLKENFSALALSPKPRGAAMKEKIPSKGGKQKSFPSLSSQFFFLFNLAGLLLELIVRCRGFEGLVLCMLFYRTYNQYYFNYTVEISLL
jgi:hypothetical protein